MIETTAAYCNEALKPRFRSLKRRMGGRWVRNAGRAKLGWRLINHPTRWEVG
jgi:hypothetical protein